MFFNKKKLIKSELDNLANSFKKEFAPINRVLGEFLLEFCLKNSKKIRPILFFLLIKALDKEITVKDEKIIFITELIHHASILHDDVIDNEKERRSNKTLNKIEGNNIAIISGDLILTIAMQKLTELNDFKITQNYLETVGEMCHGEIWQHFNKFRIPTIEDYIEKSRKKTANLFTATAKSLNLGENIEKFALNFGIAFQIRNDIKDVISKNFKDREEGIYTCVDIFHSSIEKSKGLMDNYFEVATEYLSILDNNEYKSAILELIGTLRDI